jgi:cysteine desulfurase
MAEALKISEGFRASEKKRLQEISSAIYEKIFAALPSERRNGHPDDRLEHNLSLTIPGIEAIAIIHRLKTLLSFSAGSACSTTKVEPSHVLRAIGLSDEETFQTIRFGLGRLTVDGEIIADILIEEIAELQGGML